MQNVLANVAVSLSELKRSPAAVLNEAKDAPVAILGDDRVMAYVVPASAYEAMLSLIDDLELASLVRERAGEEPVKVSLDEL